MGEFLVSLFLVSLSVGILGYLSYPMKSEKTVKFAFAAILLYAIVSPLPSLVSALSDFDFSVGEYIPDISGNFDKTYEEVAREAYSEGVKNYVSDKYSLSSECVSVKISGFDFEKMKAEKVVITLRGSAAAADWRSIEAHIYEAGLGKCEVICKFE